MRTKSAVSTASTSFTRSSSRSVRGSGWLCTAYLGGVAWLGCRGASAPPAAAPAAAADPADANRLSTIYDDVPTEQASAGAGQPAIYRHAATGERPVFQPEPEPEP